MSRTSAISRFSSFGATITGHKFANYCCQNGTWDSGEPGLEGWEIKLINFGDPSEVYTTLTDENGQFVFEYVAAGGYFVVEEQRDGWTQCIEWPKNYPLRNQYVVIVTDANAAGGETIETDVYGDLLRFGNKPPVWEWGSGQLRGVDGGCGDYTSMTEVASGPCS